MLGIFSNTASSAALLSTQVFTPYGAQLVANGNSIGQYTNKGFTGQYSDAVSGLDYYVSRYYDPVAGVFLSADGLAGNLLGMNPYGYVGNNPETFIDPTGAMYVCPSGCGGGSSGGSGSSGNNGSSVNSGYSGGYGNNSWGTYADAPVADPSVVQEVEQIIQQAWDNPEETGAVVGGVGLVATLCPVCLPVAGGLLLFGVILSIPSDSPMPSTAQTATPASSPVSMGSDLTLPTPVNSLKLGQSMITPTLQVGGGSGGKKPPTRPTASPPGEPPGGRKGPHWERRSSHSDARSAFDYIMQQIGPLADNTRPTFVQSFSWNEDVAGLQNEYQDDVSSWRLDYDPNDPQKGLHFNWMLGKRFDNMYGAASFPGTYGTYQNMLLGLSEGGIQMMLDLWAP